MQRYNSLILILLIPITCYSCIDECATAQGSFGRFIQKKNFTDQKLNLNDEASFNLNNFWEYTYGCREIRRDMIIERIELSSNNLKAETIGSYFKISSENKADSVNVKIVGKQFLDTDEGQSPIIRDMPFKTLIAKEFNSNSKSYPRPTNGITEIFGIKTDPNVIHPKDTVRITALIEDSLRGTKGYGFAFHWYFQNGNSPAQTYGYELDRKYYTITSSIEWIAPDSTGSINGFLRVSPFEESDSLKVGKSFTIHVVK